MEQDLFEDDGTLACLKIPADRSNKRFACKEERQENLIGKSFWLLDFFPEVQTRYGSRYLYKASFEKDAPESKCFKVFTGSTDCGYILEKLQELNKFPRKVTLKKEGKNHLFNISCILLCQIFVIALFAFALYKYNLYIRITKIIILWKQENSQRFGVTISLPMRAGLSICEITGRSEKLKGKMDTSA